MSIYKPEDLNITGYDLETTGVPEIREYPYEAGNVLKDDNNVITKVQIDSEYYDVDHIIMRDKEIKVKSRSKLIEINTENKNIRETVIPDVTSYGYVSFTIKTPSYNIDEENKKITIEYKDETKEINYATINYVFDKKTKQKRLDSFSSTEGKLYILKDGFTFQREIKSSKKADKPLWDYFKNFIKNKENNKFYSVNEEAVFSPFAVGLTRLFQTRNLKKMTTEEEIKEWMDKFRDKISKEEPDLVFPEIFFNGDSDKYWDTFEKYFVEIYNATELSKFPVINEQEWSELINEMEKSEIIFGHNIIGFDNLLVGYNNQKDFQKFYNKTFIDTMLLPIKLGDATVKNLNRAITQVINKSKLFTAEEKVEMGKLQEERTKYHDALLDITANFYPFAEQLQKIYTKPNTEFFKKTIDINLIEIPEEPAKHLPEIDTLIGIGTDNEAFGNIEKISEISEKNEYKNVSVSNYILNDFSLINEELHKKERKSIVSMKILVDNEEVIAVLKNKEDQEKIEILLDNERNITIKQFEVLLKNENTLEFLVKPTFESQYSFVSEKIGIRVDPFIDFDYENTKFRNKRVLTISAKTDENDINRFMAAESYKAIRNNSVLTGEVDYLKLLSWNPKKMLYGIPTKEELGKIFPLPKYKDIYSNANKIGLESNTFDLYSSNAREEFPDLEKLFGFELPKINKIMMQNIIKDMNYVYRDNPDIEFVYNEDTNSYKISSAKSISHIRKEIDKVYEELAEKTQWKYLVKNIMEDYSNRDQYKAMLYNYILNDEFEIILEDVIEGFNSFDTKGKVEKILEYVELNFKDNKLFNDKFAEKVEEYAKRDEKELRVFSEMKIGKELNTSLSTFYFKYLMLNRFVLDKIYPEKGIETGPGRGSAGGSSVAFKLGITYVDPMRYGTIFERFTHEFKTSKPDIDTDHSNRQEAIDAVEEYMNLNYSDKEERMKLLGIKDESLLTEQKFFKNILNIVYFTRKTMFKGLAKALRMSALNSKALEINFNENMSLKDNIEAIVDSKLRGYFDAIPMSIVETLDNESRNLIRNLGKHASGNILFNKSYEKVYTHKGPVEEYGERGEMPEKLDVLGLQTLEILLKYKINSAIIDVNNKYNLSMTTYQINEFIRTFSNKKNFYNNFIDFANEKNINIINTKMEEINTIYNSYNNDYIFSNFNDLKILEMLKDQFSGGIFQMDAKTQRKLLKSTLSILEIAKIEKIEHFKNMNVLTILTIINAVNRPGPLMAGMGDEIIINLRNDLINGLEEKGKLDNYSEEPFLKNHIKKFRENNNTTSEYYESTRFEEFWTTNIENEERLVKNEGLTEGLIAQMLIQGKTKPEIIEVFRAFEQKLKNIPKVNEILESSNGTILYQEQIMQLAQELGGLSDEQADDLRKAVAKSKKDKIIKMINIFINGSVNKGIITKEEAEYLGIKFQGFGSYAFNKAHSQAYALIGFLTAKQKVMNPSLFYAVNFNFAKMESVANMIDEIEKLDGVNLITGDINNSVDMFTVKDKDILIPLSSYKGLSEIAAETIINELTNGKPFKSLYDLFYRTQPELDKRSFEVLLKSGLLNEFIQREGLTVKTLSENVTEFFAIIKEFYLKDNPAFIDIDKLTEDKNKLISEIKELEEEKEIYSNPVEIEIELEALKTKLSGLEVKIEKGIEKNISLKQILEDKLANNEVERNITILEILNNEENINKNKLSKLDIVNVIKDIEKDINLLETIRNEKIIDAVSNYVTNKYPKQKTLFLKRKPEKQEEEMNEYLETFVPKTDNLFETSNNNLLSFDKEEVMNLVKNTDISNKDEIISKYIVEKYGENPYTSKDISLSKLKLEIVITSLISELKNKVKELDLERKSIKGTVNAKSEDGIKEKLSLIDNLKNNKEEYTKNDMNINRYSLLKNYNVENITVNVNELPVFDKDNRYNIIKTSSMQYNGADYVDLNTVLKNKYKIDFDNKLNKAIWNGKNAKMLFFVDYIPDKDDNQITEFSVEQGDIFEFLYKEQLYRKDPDSKWKNYCRVNKEGKLDMNDTLSFKYNKKDKVNELVNYGQPVQGAYDIISYEPKVYVKDKNSQYNSYVRKISEDEFDAKDVVNLKFNKETEKQELYSYGRPLNVDYKPLKAIPNCLKYFNDILIANGLTLHDVMVLPAFPLTKKQYKEVEESGVNINFTDSIFTSRIRNILEKNEIKFALFTDTMNNSVTRRWNLAGQETAISLGKPYILKLGEVWVNCIQVPTVQQGMRMKKQEAIEGLSNILDSEGINSAEIDIEREIEEREERLENLNEKKLSNNKDIVIEVEVKKDTVKKTNLLTK